MILMCLFKTYFNINKILNGNPCVDLGHGILNYGRISILKRYVHQYRETLPWENAVELSEHLIRTVVYHDNGLLVLNKPFGITFSRSGNLEQILKERKERPGEQIFKKHSQNESKHFKDNQYYSSGIVNDSLSLVDCLPYLKKHFSYDKLYISRVPGKYISGVAILTTNPDLVDKINKIHTSQPSGKDSYVAVVVGVPRLSFGEVKLALQLENNSNIGKKVVIQTKWSNNARKRGDVRVGTFHHQTLSRGYNDLTSLVEIRADLRAYNSVRVFAADYLLSPVVGDNLFGSRVQTLLGVPTLVHHFSEAALKPQRLPDEVYRLLGVDPGNAGIIPVHVHLSEMLLPNFLGRNKPTIVLKAPPPPHFEWTCNKLGLLQGQEAIVAV